MTDLTLKLSTPGQLVARALPYFPGSVQGTGGLVVTVSGGVYTIAPASGSLISTSVQNTFTAPQNFNGGIQGTQDTSNGLTTIGASYNYNSLSISDGINAGANVVNGLSIFLGMANAAVQGPRQAVLDDMANATD